MKVREGARRVGVMFAAAVTAMVLVSGVVYAATAKPGITMQVSPASQSITRGSATTYSLAVGSTNGFAGPVTLGASGLPAGSSAAFTRSTIPMTSSGSGSRQTTSVTITTSAATPVGSYKVTFTGTSGKTVGSVSVGLIVNYRLSSGLSLSVSPSTMTVAPGSSAVYTAQLARTALSGPVTMAVRGTLPAGASWSFSPNPTRGTSSTLQVSVPVTSAEGSYTINLVASAKDEAGTDRFAYATVQLAVKKSRQTFTIAGNPQGLLAPGITAPLRLSLSNGNRKALNVTNLTVALQSITRTPTAVAANLACTAADYRVRQYSGPYPLTVPASSTLTLAQLGVPPHQWPAVTLLDRPVNQDGCKGARVTLAYGGTGQGS